MTDSSLAAVREAASPPAAEPGAAGTEVPDAASAAKAATALAASIARICTEAGVPALTEKLVATEGMTEERATADAAAAAKAHDDIRSAVALAREVNGKIDPALADTFIKAGKSLAEVRGELLTKLHEMQGAEGNGSHQADTGPTASNAWDQAIAKVNGRK